MRKLRMILLAGAALSASPAVAADALKFGPAPAWVHAQPIPTPEKTEAPVALLLQDEQIVLEPGKATKYGEEVFKIENSQGLDAGNISLVWQPATETVTVNKLQIRRGDKVIDVLAGGQTFTVLRRETNLDAATLDGTLTATIQPEGLQEGDIIDFAMTTEHSDPVLKSHVEAMFGAWDALPIQVAHGAISWPTSLHVNLRETANLPASRTTTANGMTHAEFVARDVEPPVPPKDAPVRFQIGRLAEATDFSSWSQLSDLMIPLYRDASVIPASGQLHDEVEKIRGASNDPKARAAQALALVQDRVRYVALLMGEGGYVPATAADTWSRRFGDCKAKTALLLGILHSLGVQAEPVLVQAKIGDMIGDRLPLIGLFNHVLVRAHIGGRDYWLDGTRSGDTDVDAIETPDFGWVLPVVEHAQLVHLVPRALDVPSVEHRINIDAGAGVYVPAATTIEEIFRGDTAVGLNTLYSAASAAQRDEAMHNEAKRYFDDFTIASSSLSFDKAKREFDITVKGTAKLNWKDGWAYVPTSSIAFDPDFERPAGPLHDVPIGVNYPRFVHDKVVIQLPSGFGQQQKLSPAVHKTLAGVEYARSETLAGNVLTVESSERSIAPEVAYKDAVAAAPQLRALDKDDVYLQIPSGVAATEADIKERSGETLTTASDYLDRGLTYLGRDDYDKAIADFSQALTLDPTDKWALANRAVALVGKRDFAAGEKDLAELEKRDPGNIMIVRARAMEAELKGDCSTAVLDYSKSIAQDSSDVYSLGHRSNCEFRLQRYEAALADSALALRSNPAWMDLRILRANIYEIQGKPNLLAAEAEALVRENPDSDFAWVGAGKIYAALGQRDKAMQALDRAAAIKPAAYIYINRAEVRPPHDYAARLADVDQALKLDPDNQDAISEKASILKSQGDYKSALALLDKAKAAPDNHYIVVERASLLYKLARATEAQKLLGTVRAQAKSATDFNNLCWTEATQDMFVESAPDDCREALKLKPDTGTYLDSLGMALLKLGKLDEALDAYNQAVAKGVGAESLMGRAFVYLRKGDRTHAESDAAAARKLSASIDDTFAAYGLKWTAGSAKATAASRK